MKNFFYTLGWMGFHRNIENHRRGVGQESPRHAHEYPGGYDSRAAPPCGVAAPITVSLKDCWSTTWLGGFLWLLAVELVFYAAGHGCIDIQGHEIALRNFVSVSLHS